VAVEHEKTGGTTPEILTFCEFFAEKSGGVGGSAAEQSA
jgi:hypothetical protein